MKGKVVPDLSKTVTTVGGRYCREERAELPVRKSHLNQIQPSGEKWEIITNVCDYTDG